MTGFLLWKYDILLSYMLEEKDDEPVKGVESIGGVNFELGVENPLPGGTWPAGEGLNSDDPTGL